MVSYEKGLTYGLVPSVAYGLAVLTSWLDWAGIQYELTSTYRSQAEQDALYANRASNPYPVARVSKHSEGRAFDLWVHPQWDPVIAFWAPYCNLRWGGTFSRPDRVHFEEAM